MKFFSCRIVSALFLIITKIQAEPQYYNHNDIPYNRDNNYEYQLRMKNSDSFEQSNYASLASSHTVLGDYRNPSPLPKLPLQVVEIPCPNDQITVGPVFQETGTNSARPLNTVQQRMLNSSYSPSLPKVAPRRRLYYQFVPIPLLYEDTDYYNVPVEGQYPNKEDYPPSFSSRHKINDGDRLSADDNLQGYPDLLVNETLKNEDVRNLNKSSIFLDSPNDFDDPMLKVNVNQRVPPFQQIQLMNPKSDANIHQKVRYYDTDPSNMRELSQNVRITGQNSFNNSIDSNGSCIGHRIIQIININSNNLDRNVSEFWSNDTSPDYFDDSFLVSGNKSFVSQTDLANFLKALLNYNNAITNKNKVNGSKNTPIKLTTEKVPIPVTSSFPRNDTSSKLTDQSISNVTLIENPNNDTTPQTISMGTTFEGNDKKSNKKRSNDFAVQSSPTKLIFPIDSLISSHGNEIKDEDTLNAVKSQIQRIPFRKKGSFRTVRAIDMDYPSSDQFQMPQSDADFLNESTTKMRNSNDRDSFSIHQTAHVERYDSSVPKKILQTAILSDFGSFAQQNKRSTNEEMHTDSKLMESPLKYGNANEISKDIYGAVSGDRFNTTKEQEYVERGSLETAEGRFQIETTGSEEENRYNYGNIERNTSQSNNIISNVDSPEKSHSVPFEVSTSTDEYICDEENIATKDPSVILGSTHDPNSIRGRGNTELLNTTKRSNEIMEESTVATTKSLRVNETNDLTDLSDVNGEAASALSSNNLKNRSVNVARQREREFYNIPTDVKNIIQAAIFTAKNCLERNDCQVPQIINQIAQIFPSSYIRANGDVIGNGIYRRGVNVRKEQLSEDQMTISP